MSATEPAKRGRGVKKVYTAEELRSKTQEVLGGRVVKVLNAIELLGNTGGLLSNYDPETRNAMIAKVTSVINEKAKLAVQALREGKTKVKPTFDVFGG